MKHDFRNGTRNAGMDCRFMYGGNIYRLQTCNDSVGGLARFQLDSETVSRAMRICLQSESRMMSDGMAFGITLDQLLEQHARKKGEKVRMVMVLGENRTFAATGVWNAAMQIIEEKYRRDPVVRIGARISQLRVLDGGMA